MIFFFKQKTAYELRISDWSSDVCSSDLLVAAVAGAVARIAAGIGHRQQGVEVEVVEMFGATADLRQEVGAADHLGERPGAEGGQDLAHQIGRASCRARVCQYV